MFEEVRSSREVGGGVSNIYGLCDSNKVCGKCGTIDGIEVEVQLCQGTAPRPSLFAKGMKKKASRVPMA